MSLTPAQRRSLDGEHPEASVNFSSLGLPPEAIADSCYDPGLCPYESTGAEGEQWRGWKCGRTAYHKGEHYLDRRPGFEI